MCGRCAVAKRTDESRVGAAVGTRVGAAVGTTGYISCSRCLTRTDPFMLTHISSDTSRVLNLEEKIRRVDHVVSYFILYTRKICYFFLTYQVRQNNSQLLN